MGEHTRGHDLISVRISKIEFNACVCAWCGKPALEASLREGSPREVCIPKYEQMSKLCGRFNVWAIQCVGEHPIFEKRTGGIHRLGAHEKTDGEGVRENECVVCVCELAAEQTGLALHLISPGSHFFPRHIADGCLPPSHPFQILPVFSLLPFGSAHVHERAPHASKGERA